MPHAEIWTASFLASSLPSSSQPVWPSRFTSGHLLQRAQGDTWLLRHRWAPVLLDLRRLTASWLLSVSPFLAYTPKPESPCEVGANAPHSLMLFYCDANLRFCCERGRSSSRLTHFQLTDTIIHCLHWEFGVRVCVCAHSRNSAC